MLLLAYLKDIPYICSKKTTIINNVKKLRTNCKQVLSILQNIVKICSFSEYNRI